MTVTSVVRTASGLTSICFCFDDKETPARCVDVIKANFPKRYPWITITSLEKSGDCCALSATGMSWGDIGRISSWLVRQGILKAPTLGG